MGSFLGGLVSAGGSIASALITAEIAEDALDFQKKSLREQVDRLNALDPSGLNAQATITDVLRRANSLLALEQVDPALAAIRRRGAEEVLRQAGQVENQADVLASQLFREVKDQDPRLSALKGQLLTAAQAELDAGATLPPDFQAELVRTGLERAGTAGFGAGAGVTGTELRKLLGREAINLKAARQQQAISLAGAAQDIDNARVNILAGVFPKLKDLQTANLSRAQSVLATGEAAAPKVGLSGEDVTNIELTKAGAQNQLTSQAGDLAAQGALARGQLINQLIGAGTQLATSTISAANRQPTDYELAKKHGLI